MKPIRRTAIPRDHASDELLWIDFKNGDREAFATLYYRYFRTLIQRSLNLCEDTDLIKDCVHDLFVEIWKNRLNLGIPHSVKAYLLRSLQRKVIRHIKKNKSGKTVFSPDKMADTGVVHSIEKKIIAEQFREEQRNGLIRAIRLLTKRQQQAIYLKFYANLSYPEIAGRMSISTDSTYNLISKAIGNMHDALQKYNLEI
jgi:RNA polymerase sigma factor (sigma-70 family)